MALVRTFGVCILTSAVVALAGCHYQETTDTIRRRHAALYGCAPADVTITEISYDGAQNRGQFVADGCGRRASYYCASSNCVEDGSTSGGER